jgi:type I restriction enzyme, S subunit
MRFGLEEHIVEGLISVFEKYSKVDKAIVFGSRAKGNYRPDSDIDIAIKGAELTEKDVLNIHVKFSELDLSYKVDLLNYNTIKEPELKAHIDRVGIELYSRWKKIPLSKTTKFIVDNRGKTVPTASNGIPLIATNCIDNDNLYPKFENIRYISKETYDTWFRSHPEPGDIILTLKGSQNGAVCLVPDPVGFAIAQDMVALRVNEEIIDSHFLFAALRSAEIQSEIKNLDVSGVIPHLKKSDFDKLMLPYPDMGTQKKIGSVYYSLSSKIDLLHRQNKTLEQLAVALFRHLFVEDAEANKEVGKLGDYINVVYGKGLPTKNLLPKGYSVFGANGNIGFYDKYTYELPQVLVSCRGEASGVVNFSEPKSFITNNSLILERTKSPGISFEFLKYFSLNTDYSLYVTGSAQPQITIGSLIEAPFILPPQHLIDSFTEIVGKFELKRISNKSQIDTLIKTRDSLLPKLISGEVRILETNALAN